jgi:hypothetical protein
VKLGSRLRCFFNMKASQRTRTNLYLALVCSGLEGTGLSEHGEYQPLGKLTEREALALIGDCQGFIGEKKNGTAQP